MTQRKILIPLKPMKEKNTYTKVFEKKGSLGFARSRGIFQKSIDKKSALMEFLRDGKSTIHKEADDLSMSQKSNSSCEREDRWQSIQQLN